MRATEEKKNDYQASRWYHLPPFRKALHPVLLEKNMMKYIRTCQECLHQQESKDPKGNPTDLWLNAKCRKCGSTALDYGSWKDPKERLEG